MRLVKYIFFVGMCGASTVAPYPTCGHNQPWLHALNTPCSTETKKPAWQRFFLAKMVVTPYNKISRYGRQWAFRRASLGGQLDKLDQKIELLRQRGMGHNKSASMIKTIFFDRSPQQLAKDLESLPQGCDPASSCVVSLTSYPARMHAGITLAALVSLVRSQVKPHAIVLYLSKDQFPEGKIGGPYDQAYRVLQDKGVTVRYVDGDLRAHKKYFYVCDDYPHHAHMTVDDDIYYAPSMIGATVQEAKHHPQDIVCWLCFQMTGCFDDQTCQPLLLCSDQNDNMFVRGHAPSASFRLVAAAGVGKLYPAHTLKQIRDLIKKYDWHNRFVDEDMGAVHIAGNMVGVKTRNIPFFSHQSFAEINHNGQGHVNGLSVDNSEYIDSCKRVIKADINYHRMCSHRFPEYDNKNAYEVMNMVPNPDVVKALAEQSQSAHRGVGAEKSGCAR